MLLGWRKGKWSFALLKWESKQDQGFQGREIFVQKDRQALEVEPGEGKHPFEQMGRHLV